MRKYAETKNRGLMTATHRTIFTPLGDDSE